MTASEEGPLTGSFTADMNSLRSLDIQNENMRNTLDNHLKSDDFFSVDTYPEANLLFKEINLNENGTFSIIADMTLRGTTNEISIDEAKITQIDENTILAETFFEVDRTEFNIRYGSGKFFQNLENSLINDKIEFKVNTILNK